MHCPDCGHLLTPIPLGINGEAHDSYRCYRCGGFWIEGWLVNRLNSKMLDKWPNVGGMHGVANDGNGMCPLHPQMKLERFDGESVPQHLTVKRCKLCKWWWFPHNTIFQFKPAQEAKIQYYRAWGMPADLRGLMLPVLSLLIMVSGGIVAVQLVTRQQLIETEATGLIDDLIITYTGQGRGVVSFSSLIDVSQIEFRSQQSTDWMTINVILENGFYKAEIYNLKEGQVYEVRIFGRIYKLQTF